MNAIEMIEEAGFDAVEASNADETIAILEARSGIGVLFNDIQMPGGLNSRPGAKQAIPLLTTISVSEIAFGI